MCDMLVMLDDHDALRSADLNLLVVLEALFAERHVTRASVRLGMTQSGCSRALARLRETFDDALFVPGPRGLEPTPRADGLREALGRVLLEVRVMLRAPVFDPAKAAQPMRLGIPDHLAYLIAPRLLKLLRERAPNMSLVARGFSRDWRRELRDGEVDLAFGVLSGEEGELRRRTCLEDPWVVLVRAGHPALKRRWTVERFAALDHGMMTVTGSGPGHVDRALARQGLSRRVVYRASSPVVAAMAAASTDLAVTTTERLARELARSMPLRIKPLPLDVPALELPLVWHERDQHDPRHRWMRELVVEAVA